MILLKSQAPYLRSIWIKLEGLNGNLYGDDEIEWLLSKGRLGVGTNIGTLLDNRLNRGICIDKTHIILSPSWKAKYYQDRKALRLECKESIQEDNINTEIKKHILTLINYCSVPEDMVRESSLDIRLDLRVLKIKLIFEYGLTQLL